MKRVYLRTRREQLGLTQEALEEKSGVAQNTISKLESRAPLRPAFSTVMALARALHVEPAQLRFGPDPRRGPVTRRSAIARAAAPA